MGERNKHSPLIKDFSQWMQDHVARKSPLYNNMPPCPFAARAMARGEVTLSIIEDLEPIAIIKTYSPQVGMSHIFLWPNFRDMSEDEFDDWLYEQNENNFGHWVMAFDPRADREFPVWQAFNQDDYAILLVQSLLEISEASANLSNTGYYRHMPDHILEHIANREVKAHAWNEIEKRLQSQGKETCQEER